MDKFKVKIEDNYDLPLPSKFKGKEIIKEADFFFFKEIYRIYNEITPPIYQEEKIINDIIKDAVLNIRRNELKMKQGRFISLNIKVNKNQYLFYIAKNRYSNNGFRLRKMLEVDEATKLKFPNVHTEYIDIFYQEGKGGYIELLYVMYSVNRDNSSLSLSDDVKINESKTIFLPYSNNQVVLESFKEKRKELLDKINNNK